MQSDSAVLFPIEVETPVSLPFKAQQDLVTLYNVEKGSLAKSSVDQIYSYMAANSLLYGMLTIGGAMWFMRQSDGELQVSGAVNIASPHSSQNTAAEGMIYLHQLAVEQQASTPMPSAGVTIFGGFRTSTFSWLEAGLALVGCHIFLKVRQLFTSRGSVKQQSVYSIQELHLDG